VAGNFPYRRDTTIDPYSFKITGPNDAIVATTINKQQLADNGIETFRFVNPAKCWVWLRGLVAGDVAGATYATINQKGHLFPPGAVEVMKSQYPDAIAVVAADMPDLRVLDSNGTYLFPNRYAWLHYGGGF